MSFTDPGRRQPLVRSARGTDDGVVHDPRRYFFFDVCGNAAAAAPTRCHYYPRFGSCPSASGGFLISCLRAARGCWGRLGLGREKRDVNLAMFQAAIGLFQIGGDHPSWDGTKNGMRIAEALQSSHDYFAGRAKSTD
jgi:hypothetical protein